MSRARAQIAFVSFSIFALISTAAHAQYTNQQCISIWEQSLQSQKERSYKTAVSLERQYLSYCKDHMLADDYLSHLYSLASSLNYDQQRVEALGVANRCLQINATELPCLLQKAIALYSLGRSVEAKPLIEKSLTIGAVTEIDAAAQKNLRELLADVNTALKSQTQTAGDGHPAPRIAKSKMSTGVSGKVSCIGSSVGITIDIHGEINSAATESVSKLFNEFHEQQKKVESGIVCDDAAARQRPPSAYGDHYGISSGGGSIYEAMAIGRLFRKERAWLSVDGVCFSACVLILAGAVDRHIGDSNEVGIHRPYFGTTPEKPLKADQVKQEYVQMLKDMRNYLREMNVPQRLADDMLAIEPEDNRILTKAELKSYRLAGVDPMEQQSRAVTKEAADIQEANQLGLDRREYTRRKALGDSICNRVGESNYLEANACKQRVLNLGP
jgi:hypothetical protein